MTTVTGFVNCFHGSANTIHKAFCLALFQRLTFMAKFHDIHVVTFVGEKGFFYDLHISLKVPARRSTNACFLRLVKCYGAK